MYLPTYLNQRDECLPTLDEEAARYVIAENGIFLERRSPVYATSVRLGANDLELVEHEEYCRLTCGRIPRVTHRAMLSFFQGAYALHGGEAALVLLYHAERKQFRWRCPEQFVDLFPSFAGWTTGDTIEYRNPLTVPGGFVVFGDAHLHVGSPTPSYIDVVDDQDGLHIIVGNIRSTPSYHADFVMDGRRFCVPPEALFEDVACRPFRHAPHSWLKQIYLRQIQNGTIVTRPVLQPRELSTENLYR